MVVPKGDQGAAKIQENVWVDEVYFLPYRVRDVIRARGRRRGGLCEGLSHLLCGQGGGVHVSSYSRPGRRLGLQGKEVLKKGMVYVGRAVGT